MKKITNLLIFLGASLAQSANAQTLTGIAEFSSTAAGQASGISVWNTKGNDTVVNIFVSSGTGLLDPFINGPSDANSGISVPLGLGTHSFTLFSGSGGFFADHAINLFFNGNNVTPRISAVGATKTSVGSNPAFSANGSSNTKDLGGFGSVPGANSLSYLDGNKLISLTDYWWAAPAVYNIDRVAAPAYDPGHVATDGVSDWVGHISLTVTQVPEPSVAGILLIASVGIFCRLKKHSA